MKWTGYFVLLMLTACSKNDDDCSSVTSPAHTFFVGLEDQQGSSLVGPGRTYSIDSIHVISNGEEVPTTVFNEKGYYYVSFDYQGLQRYNGLPYFLNNGVEVLDTFTLQVVTRDEDCWLEYFISEITLNGETQPISDTLTITKL